MSDESIDTLEADLDRLTEAYQALLRQFDCTLQGAERVKLETELATIDRQMSEIENKIAGLK
jgi:hypothetical protein